jgi:hypothetical protein
LTQFSAPAIVQIVSEGPTVSGIIDHEAIVVDGTTPVSWAKTFDRILKVISAPLAGAP